MFATNFVYDNTLLSSYGLCICRFYSDASVATVSAGSQIDFHLSAVPGRDKRLFFGSAYAETLSAVLQVGKIDCNGRATALTAGELSHLMRWLNRKDGFYKFKLLQEDFETLYALASFQVRKIEVNGKVYGLELTMTTLHPYLLEEQAEVEITFTPQQEFSLYDNSDETGHIYPTMIITCQADGDLELTNSMEERKTVIRNCKANEIITIDGENMLISSSLTAHDISNDFNFVFPRVVNTYENRENKISVSLPCSIRFLWSPIRKVGF